MYSINAYKLRCLNKFALLTYHNTNTINQSISNLCIFFLTFASHYSDIELNGYKIPAGSHVVPLINSVHMDPTLWQKPEEFNPGRFLDNEGKVRKPEYFIPFGVGRRKCLGDILARMELFLFFSSMAHTFNIHLPVGQAMPSLKGCVGVTISPEKFKICFTARPLHKALIPLIETAEHLRNVGSN